MDIQVFSPVIAEAEVKKYTLCGDDIYIRRYTNSTIPEWYRQLISDIIATDTTITDMDGAIDYLNTLTPGYNQVITELQEADVIINSSIDSLVATTGSHTAAIGNLNSTKVDAAGAASVALTTIGTYFADGTAGSWFNNEISTYASDIQSNAMNISTLSATLGNHTVKIDTIEQVNISQDSDISDLNTAISTLETNTGISLQELQDQIDGSISTWFHTYDTEYVSTDALYQSTQTGVNLVRCDLVWHVDTMYVFLSEIDTQNIDLNLETYPSAGRWRAVTNLVPDVKNYPASQWTTNSLRNEHLGDLAYNLATGYVYRWTYEDLEDDPDQGLIYGWVQITDTDVVTALTNAATAQDTADGKRTVFYSATTPTPRTINETTIPIEIGDLWVHSTTGVTKVAVTVTPSVVWGDITNTATQNALLALVDLEEARDGNIVIYYLTSPGAASGMTYGDYLVDIDSWDGTIYTVYRYQDSTGGSTGTLAWYVNNGDTSKALSSGYRSQILAGTAQSTADGKVKVWYQTTAPALTTSDVGDMWVDTDNSNKLQVWSGTVWTDPTSAQGTQAYTWSANASKLITSPDGSVTGWSFGDGSNIQSYFKVNATNFSISDGTTGYTPFSIVGSDIQFDGNVSFNNLTDVPTINKTWVQTTEPSTGMIAGDTWIDTDDNNKMYSYDGTTWNPVGAGIKTYLQTTEPTTDLSIGDIWVDSDDNYKQYRYSGTTFVAIAYNPATAINAGTTTISGGKLTTGSVTADKIDVITLSAISANIGTVTAGVLYDNSWNGSTYKMKIDLNNGEIHIV